MFSAGFFWVAGWVFYWVGSHKKMDKQVALNSKRELTFDVLMPEQKCAR
jgi:hypothetical protein